MRKPFIVAYDVADPKRLQGARLAVTNWAHGGQKSVWECWAADPTQIIGALQSGLSPRHDRLALARLRLEQSRFLGRAIPSSDHSLRFIG